MRGVFQNPLPYRPESLIHVDQLEPAGCAGVKADMPFDEGSPAPLLSNKQASWNNVTEVDPIVKTKMALCGSKAILSGVNSHVMMPSDGHHSADDERAITNRWY